MKDPDKIRPDLQHCLNICRYMYRMFFLENLYTITKKNKGADSTVNKNFNTFYTKWSQAELSKAKLNYVKLSWAKLRIVKPT